MHKIGDKASLDMLTTSKQAQSEFGPRSSKKLVPIHGFLAQAFIHKLEPHGISVMSKGVGNGREGVLKHLYGSKNVDLYFYDSISGNPYGSVEIKQAISSVSKNSNNTHENIVGATSIIREAGYVAGLAMFVPLLAPVYDKYKNIKGIDILSDKEVDKWRILNERKEVTLSAPSEMLYMPIQYHSTDFLNANDINVKDSSAVTQAIIYNRENRKDQKDIPGVFSKKNYNFLTQNSQVDTFVSNFSELIINKKSIISSE